MTDQELQKKLSVLKSGSVPKSYWENYWPRLDQKLQRVSVGGKVEFSISSVAYPDAQPLIPLVVILPRAKEAFEARFLIRPGQAARVEGAWDKKTVASMHLQLSPDGRKATVGCRLNGSGL